MKRKGKKRQGKFICLGLEWRGNYNIATFCLFFPFFLYIQTDLKKNYISTPPKNLCFHEEERLMRRRRRTTRTRLKLDRLLSKRTQKRGGKKERRKQVLSKRMNLTMKNVYMSAASEGSE